MILTTDDITRIIKERPNKALVDTVQEYSKKLTMHITGTGLDSYIAKLEYFEKEELYKIRKKYTRSNKDMFARLHRPIDKIFTANGGSAYYNLPEGEKRTFIDILSDVEWGHSLRNWIKTFWRPTFHYDPMGLILMEVDNKGETYPTYKTTASIFDYQLTGRQPEYVVFSTDIKIDKAKYNDDKQRVVYRVVDDAMDYLIEWDGTAATILKDKSYKNYYGKVPGWVISDLYDPQKGYYVSPDDNVIELADQYLREGGVLNVFKNNFGFPQRWRYQAACDVCRGMKNVGGSSCTACNGSGKKHKADPSQDVVMPIPGKEDPVLSPPAGNIETAVESWDKMDSSIDTLFNLAYYTKWGVQHNPTIQGAKSAGEGQKTATEVVNEEQPKIEALFAYSNAAESTEKMIADYMGEFYYPSSYKGADINYGKRFMLESPDKVLESLSKLIKEEAPYEIVREKMEEYYHTLYQGDSVKLNTALKLIDVEPLPFYSMTKCKQLLSPLEFAKKSYYNDWRGVKEVKDTLMKATVEQLRKSLHDYTIKRATDDYMNLPESLKPVQEPVKAI